MVSQKNRGIFCDVQKGCHGILFECATYEMNNGYRLSAWVIVIALAACNQSQKPAQPKMQPVPKPADMRVNTDSSANVDTARTAAQANDSTSKYNAADSSQEVLTLPVLDALFYEPDFVKALESQLHLPADKIARLKSAAHESFKALSEYGSPDTASAKVAAAQYQQQIRSLIGEDKARQLLRLVYQRYSQGVEGLAPTRPNFVPTDTRIVVNAPAFRMDVFDKGHLVKSYKVGIGYPEFPLPVGMRRADTIIFHPSWTPPDEPWVHGKFEPGRKVSAASKLNPLGIIKIPIGLPSLIHGGKSPEQIGKLASHGCVGLTNSQVLNLAPIVLRLGQSDLSPKAIHSLVKHKTPTKKVKLPTPVPVDLRYETIVAENGGLHIYRDVYERGTNTLEDAKAVLASYGVKYEQLSASEQNDLEAALAEMDRDARGRTIAASDSATARKDTVPTTTSPHHKKVKVTLKIKGRTNVFVKLAALQGKGYPAPVDLLR